MAEHDDELHSGRFSIIPAVALEDPRMTPALLKLLGVLGTYGNKYGYCWPKRETLARRLGGISKPAVSQGIRKLKELGYIEVTSRYRSDGAQKENCYRILFDVTPEMPSELTPGLALEVTPRKALEVTPLNVPSERPTFFNTSAAASLYPGGKVTPWAEPTAEAAAAENEIDVSQTAEACRKHLRMGHDKLAGLKLIIACWPGRRAWLENQANLCFQTLKIRPLQLNHFSNWLDTAETRRTAPREEGASHDLRSDETNTITPHPPAPADQRGPDGLTDAEREAVREQLNALVAQTIRPHAAG